MAYFKKQPQSKDQKKEAEEEEQEFIHVTSTLIRIKLSSLVNRDCVCFAKKWHRVRCDLCSRTAAPDEDKLTKNRELRVNPQIKESESY